VAPKRRKPFSGVGGKEYRARNGFDSRRMSVHGVVTRDHVYKEGFLVVGNLLPDRWDITLKKSSLEGARSEAEYDSCFQKRRQRCVLYSDLDRTGLSCGGCCNRGFPDQMSPFRDLYVDRKHPWTKEREEFMSIFPEWFSPEKSDIDCRPWKGRS